MLIEWLTVTREQPFGSNESDTLWTDFRNVILHNILLLFLWRFYSCLIILSKFCFPGYIAGFTDSEVNSRPDLYDVYVNLADSEITISPLVKGWLLFMFWIWGLFVSELAVTAEPCCRSNNLGPFSILVLKRQYGSFCLSVLLRSGKTGETWNWERHNSTSNKRTVEISEHSCSTVRWERHSAEGYWIQRYHRNL